MSTTELIKGVDHAAAMDDRWLFVASLVVFGVFATFVMKYFVRQHERLIEDHKEARDSYQESLRAVRDIKSAVEAEFLDAALLASGFVEGVGERDRAVIELISEVRGENSDRERNGRLNPHAEFLAVMVGSH